jgi:hypothetical protein
MLQLATWLGFDKIYFIGIDNNFQKTMNTNIHWYEDSDNEKSSMQLCNPYLITNLISKSFKFVYKYLLKHNINIYNASISGDLNEIPRVNFKDLF